MYKSLIYPWELECTETYFYILQNHWDLYELLTTAPEFHEYFLKT